MHFHRREIAAVYRDLVLNSFTNGRLVPRAVRPRLLSRIGHRVDPSAHIYPDCFIGETSGLTIGPESFVNRGCVFDLSASITIGARVQLGPQVMLLTSSHEIGSRQRRAGEGRPASIVIGDGVWIGARTTILPGVAVGDGCVIGAGSVVTHSCEPDGVYAGVPAQRKRTLP